MICLVHEHPEIVKDRDGHYERCIFCRAVTTSWHELTNTPICLHCSKIHAVAELPDNGRLIRDTKQRLLQYQLTAALKFLAQAG